MWFLYLSIQRGVQSSGQALRMSRCLAMSFLFLVSVCYGVDILLYSRSCGVCSPWIWFNKPFSISDILAVFTSPTAHPCSKNLRWQIGELLADFEKAERVAEKEVK